MPSILRCIAGPHEGRVLTLRPERVLDMPVRARGEGDGSLRISAANGGWLFENVSAVPSLINGVQVKRAILGHGDLIKVGKLIFEVHLEGVVPRDDAETTGIEVPEQVRGKGDTVVLRVPRSHPDSETDSGTGSAPLDAEPIAETPLRVETQASGGRSRRRISASRPAIRDDQAQRRPGLFKRVSRVFRRGGRREDFRDLVILRDRLLRSMGRWAIERQGGLGLPEHFLRRLSAGESITLAKSDLASGDLEAFRRVRQRLAQIDAEIEALRHELDLPPDGVEEGLLDLLTSMDGVEERAHTAMDGYHTEPLSEDLEIVEPQIGKTAEDSEDPSSSSGARRRQRRRR